MVFILKILITRYKSLMSLTAVELGKKIKAGEVTVKEAVEAAFAQIEKVEGGIERQPLYQRSSDNLQFQDIK